MAQKKSHHVQCARTERVKLCAISVRIYEIRRSNTGHRLSKKKTTKQCGIVSQLKQIHVGLSFGIQSNSFIFTAHDHVYVIF